ncbi:hypothetical protein F7984_04565 [Pradoshia sp. D12]|uniref:hypothetical protein n=1 Tax=Bacillaceae TaxID=186817 RepID=UPI00112B5EB0|nr:MULTISPECIES: hypothetical protein [Bacillaceae]QFK70565.1 hypothetical protein F7984_04565 [Pradoshia sp. D12]TPF72361.1 hypothetical protein FHY44_00960 [Bacillus sp. D12]
MHRIKIETITFWIVTLLMGAATIIMFIEGDSTKGFMGILTCMSLVVLGGWQWKAKKPLDGPLMMMTYIFIFISVGIGTFGGGYAIKHFDDFLHVTSGIWLGYAALVLTRQIIGEELTQKLPKAFLASLMVIFALCLAGAWELLEFAGDQLFHFTAQGRDHKDTMFDMMDGLIGGIISAVFYLIIRK